MKVYKYKDTEFTLKPFSLSLLEKQTPLIRAYRRAVAKTTIEVRKDFAEEFAKVDEYEKRIGDLRKAYQTTPEENTQMKEEYKIKLQNAIDEYAADEEVQIAKKYLDESLKIETGSAFLDISLLKGVASNILVGDTSVIDWEDTEVASFMMEVITDFFTYSQPNKNE